MCDEVTDNVPSMKEQIREMEGKEKNKEPKKNLLSENRKRFFIKNND